jgi:hypothetical protein
MLGSLEMPTCTSILTTGQGIAREPNFRMAPGSKISHRYQQQPGQTRSDLPTAIVGPAWALFSGTIRCLRICYPAERQDRRGIMLSHTNTIRI